MNKKFLLKKSIVAIVVGIVGGILSKSILLAAIMFCAALVLTLVLFQGRQDRLDQNGHFTADEREIYLDYRAARILWAFMCISIGGLIIYYEIFQHQEMVPIDALSIILMIGTLGYMALSFWFKQR